MHGLLHVLFKKKHKEQITQHFEGPAESVLTAAKLASVVPHSHLCNAATFKGNQHRYEAVQLAVQPQVFGNVGLEYAQGAAIIPQIYTGCMPYDEVGDETGDFPQKKTVLPVQALAGYHIPASAFGQRQHGGNVCRIVLQIPVHGGNILAASLLYASHERKALAVIFSKRNHRKPRMLQGAQCPQTAVRRTIIDVDNLIFHTVERIRDAPDQQRNIFFLIVDGNDYR